MSPPNKKQRFVNRHSKLSHFNAHKRQKLDVGMRGFLATCNFHAKDCVRECYNLLNEYADDLYGPKEAEVAAGIKKVVDQKDDGEAPNNQPVESDDISDQLEKEIKALNAAKSKGTDHDVPKFRFQTVETGTDNCIFIRTTLNDPVELGTHVVKEILLGGKPKTRFLLRLIPIAVVCRAYINDIINAAQPVIDKYFPEEPTTFSVIFNKRYNNNIQRDEVIVALAATVSCRCDKNKVDLKQPKKTVIVEVIKGMCCLSVVDNFYKYKKYNLCEITNANVGEPTKEVNDLGNEDGDANEKVHVEEIDNAKSERRDEDKDSD